jgi:pentapeptide MXKDX repeat protein
MIKSVTTGLCILALSGGLAFAQSSQGQAGANTGPTSPTAQMSKSNPMNANARMMKKKKMKKSSKKDGMSGDTMSKDGMSGGMKKDNTSK